MASTTSVRQYEDSGIIDGLLRRIGGPLGRYAGRTSMAWVYGLATISWIICMLRQLPCRQSTPTDPTDRFGWMCYSDLTSLYYTRGMGTGAIPYISATWEYPVLTGYFASAANFLARLYGAVLSPEVDGQQILDNANIYFAVSAVGLYIFLMWLVSSVIRIVPDTAAIPIAVALSPTLMATGLINWDLIAVSLTVAGLASWLEGKPIWAGLWWGLGVAAKLYPIVIVGALIVVWLRPDGIRSLVKLRKWLTMFGVTVVAWLGANAPMMILHPEGWGFFYTMNAGRGADWGSPWLALSYAGIGVDNPAMASRITMVLGYLALAALIFFARKAPTPIQIAYLAVVVMTTGNLVYSPQFVLWILPLVILARPKLVDITVFTLAELFYFIFIWLHLRGNDLTLGISNAPWVYVLSIMVRVGATIWIVVRVVRGVLTAAPKVTEESTCPVDTWSQEPAKSEAVMSVAASSESDK